MRHMGSTVSTPPAVMTSGLVVASIMARNCLGYASRASMPSGQAPDMTKSMSGSASQRRAASADVFEPAEAALARLQVVQVHDVGAVAEVRAAAAEVHGRLAGAVVDHEARRHGFARPLDEGGRDVDEAVVVPGAAAVEHDLLALVVEHDHADVGEDAEGRLVDALLLLLGEEADAAGADLLAAALPWSLLDGVAGEAAHVGRPPRRTLHRLRAYMHAEFAFRRLDNRTKFCRDAVRQRLRPVRLEDAPGLGERAVVQRRRAGGGPLLADPPVDELRAATARACPVGVVVREEVA